jgi:hypothetical protein
MADMPTGALTNPSPRALPQATLARSTPSAGARLAGRYSTHGTHNTEVVDEERH